MNSSFHSKHLKITLFLVNYDIVELCMPCSFNYIFIFFLIYVINLVGCVANEQVAQLSEFSSPELKEIILSVVHGLLATLSPKMHSKPSTMSENTTVGPANVRSEDCAEVVENSALHFQPVISLTRDYLARLLFWLVPPRF